MADSFLHAIPQVVQRVRTYGDAYGVLVCAKKTFARASLNEKKTPASLEIP